MSSAQGSAAGPVKVEPLIDLPEASSFGRGRPMEATRRKNIWDRLGGKASDPFGSIPQGELPPPLVGSPGSPPAAIARSQIPRPWFPRTTSRGGGRGLTSMGVRPPAPAVEVSSPSSPVEAKLLSTLVEVRPPFIPLEVDPPLSSSGAGDVKQETLSPGDNQTPSSTSWGDLVERAEASGELASNTASASGQAKPTLLFSHVVTAMRPYWLSGTEPLCAVATQLLKDYDSAISLPLLQKALQFMVVQHHDLSAYLHCMIRDKMLRPGADAQEVLTELERLLHSMWKA